MSERGSFILKLKDIGGNPWTGDVEVRITDDLERVIYKARKHYSSPVTFSNLRAVPRGRHLVHVKPLYHEPASRFVTVYGKHSEDCTFRLMKDYREAERCSEWTSFPTLAELNEPRFEDLKRVLEKSQPAGPVVAHQDVKPFDQGLTTYEQLADSNHRHAACLLNLYTKMKNVSLGGFKDRKSRISAWELVDRLIAVRFDRIYAMVKDEREMDRILAWLTKSKHFSRDPDWAHNVPQPEGFKKHQITFKSNKYSYGTLQLTFSSKQGPGQAKQWALDADIDEKSGIGHWREVIYHRLTGTGTSPYAVHQLLYRQGTKPPYSLSLGCSGPL